MTSLAVIASLVYLVGLGVLARRTSIGTARPRTAAWRYALGLGVYCSSWTFFGAVGRAAKSGWEYAPIYIGPILLYIFGFGLIEKLWRVTSRTRSTSVAEVLTSRFGNRRPVAVLATLVSLAAVVPYLALQLKAIGASLAMLAEAEASVWGDFSLFGWALCLGIFAAWLGARGTAQVGPRPALVNVIAFESVAKLIALGVVAVTALWALRNGAPIDFSATAFSLRPSQTAFWLQAILGAIAIICLPRQFHMTFAEGPQPEDLSRARFVFPAYLLLMILFVVPITLAGNVLLAAGDWSPDSFVLALPWELKLPSVALVAYLGGFSAATAMIIVSTYAVGQMVSHTIAIPLLLRFRRSADASGRAGAAVRVLRQVITVSIVLAGYAFLVSTPGDVELFNLGLRAFSLIAQLAPALLLGLYWRRAHHTGAVVGIAVGLMIWFVWVLLPSLGRSPGLVETLVPSGWTLFEVGSTLALVANTIGVVVGSLLATQTMQDALGAHAVVVEANEGTAATERVWRSTRTGDLINLLRTFVATGRLDRMVERWHESGIMRAVDEPPTAELVRATQDVLAGVVGPTAAYHLVLSLADHAKLELNDVVDLVGHTAEALRFSESLLFTSLENLAHGISVIDGDLKLVAWNHRYLEMFNYPPGLVRRGTPVADLVRYNAELGRCGPGDPEEHVHKRLRHMRFRSAHTFQRRRENGRVIEMVGRALPGGGFVTSFADITEHVEAKEALERTAASLEERVAERTAEITLINDELRAEVEQRRTIQAELLTAKQAAERANRDKTRFIAAAGHDILQPLNAARLFAHAAWESAHSDDVREILSSLTKSLDSADEMMTTVFEIAKLDQGAMRPNVVAIDVGSLFDRVADQVRPLAQAKGLAFSCFRPRATIWTDPTYMRRILQNLLSNAIKYTPGGKVVLGARRRGENLRIEVWDTGIGIEAHQRSAVFDDFFRVDAAGERGSGLGLGVVSRMAAALGHPVEVRSWPGQGSCFSVSATRGPAPPRRLPAQDRPTETRNLAGCVLYLDDEEENLAAMRALVEAWGIEFIGAQRLEDALAALGRQPRPSLLVVDFQLRAKETGLEAARRLRATLGADVPTVIVTADRQPALKAAARSAGFSFLSKPVKPAALKTLLRRAQGIRKPPRRPASRPHDLPADTGDASSRKN